MSNIHTNISFGLVNIPVNINPLIRNNDITFNQLHSKCLSRINYIKYCSHCKKEVMERDIVKGYEFEKDNYVVFDKKELDMLKVRNDKEIEIVSFVPIKDIDPFYFEKSYVLSYTGKGKAYNLFCEALKKSKLVAIARTVIGSKFYYVCLKFTSNVIIMTTLYFEEEVIIPEVNVKNNFSDVELDLAIKLIHNLEGKFDPKKYKDEYQNNLRKAIDDKLSGRKIKKSNKKINNKNINDLMKALEKSLNE